MPLVRGHRRLGPEDNLAPRRRKLGKLPSRAGDGPRSGGDAVRPETRRADATTIAAICACVVCVCFWDDGVGGEEWIGKESLGGKKRDFLCEGGF